MSNVITYRCYLMWIFLAIVRLYGLQRDLCFQGEEVCISYFFCWTGNRKHRINGLVATSTPANGARRELGSMCGIKAENVWDQRCFSSLQFAKLQSNSTPTQIPC